MAFVADAEVLHQSSCAMTEMPLLIHESHICNGKNHFWPLTLASVANAYGGRFSCRAHPDIELCLEPDLHLFSCITSFRLE